MNGLDHSKTERLIHHMPAVARDARDDWTRTFAISIQRQAKRRGWQPSVRQFEIMRRLVADLFSRNDNEGEPVLFE